MSLIVMATLISMLLLMVPDDPVAQFCVNNRGDDIPAKRRQFWGGYKLLYPTLLSLGGGPSPLAPPPVPPSGIAPMR